jgi:uncharacterized cupredoxin-like copper-binding protein
MTKRFLACTLCSLLLFAACGDDDNNENGGGGNAGSGNAGSGNAGSGRAGSGGSTAGSGGGAGSTAGSGGSEVDAGTDAGNGMAGERRITLVATEFMFTPDSITASPGETLIVTMRNDGAVAHRLEFDLPGSNVEIEADVNPGESADLTVPVPDSTGDFAFFCPIDGHRALGMEGTLTVE